METENALTAAVRIALHVSTAQRRPQFARPPQAHADTRKRTQAPAHTHPSRPGDGPNGTGGASTSAPSGATSGGADWVARKARSASKAALAAVAVSSDGRYLAVGGGDSKVHVFEAGGSGAYVMGFPGHKDAVTGLVFR